MDLQLKSFCTDLASVEDLVDVYNSNVRNFFDAQAPLKHRLVLSRPTSQWCKGDFRILKREVRSLEQRYLKHKTTINLEMFRDVSIL